MPTSPAIDEDEAERFPHAGDERVRLSVAGDLAEWDAVERFYSGIEGLWASIHLAGGFDMGGIVDAPPDMFERQVSMNAATCYLCCRAAIAGMRWTGDGGRIVNVSARPGLEPRTGAGMAAYAAAKAAVAALTQALAEEVASEGIRVNAVAALDPRYPCEPVRNARRGSRRLAEDRRGRRDRRIPRLARQRGHARRGDSGVWRGLGPPRRQRLGNSRL